jgi:hypothetical protein
VEHDTCVEGRNFSVLDDLRQESWNSNSLSPIGDNHSFENATLSGCALRHKAAGLTPRLTAQAPGAKLVDLLDSELPVGSNSADGKGASSP